jgi:DNA-binding response OmpR family regulator
VKVLLVEDDSLQRDLVRNWLMARGHDVDFVGEGLEAKKRLTVGSFDVVVLDWLLPDISGQDVLCWLSGQASRPAVLFATACGGEFEMASMLELGADDYVVKPLRRLELVARVEALGRRRVVAESQ